MLPIHVQTRPKYVSIQIFVFNIIYALFQNHMKTGVQCTHPNVGAQCTRTVLHPNSRTRYVISWKIHKYNLKNIYDQFS